MVDNAYKGNVCVFVASSDNTRDVFVHVFQSFARNWPDCPFPRYVGQNTLPFTGTPLPGFHALLAPVSGWATELAAQLEQLPDSVEYVLLFLDDFFLLSPVETAKLFRIVTEATARNLEYLRLIPIARSIPDRIFRRFCACTPISTWERISPDAPYYSSLQVALWKRDYLVQLLTADLNIWQFEHLSMPNSAHYAICGCPPIKYTHLVEKARWQRFARRALLREGISFSPGKRRVVSPWGGLKRRVDILKFGLIGYSWVRLRSWLGWDLGRQSAKYGRGK